MYGVDTTSSVGGFDVEMGAGAFAGVAAASHQLAGEYAVALGDVDSGEVHIGDFEGGTVLQGYILAGGWGDSHFGYCAVEHCIDRLVIGCEVDAVVETPVLVNRVSAHTVWRGDANFSQRQGESRSAIRVSVPRIRTAFMWERISTAVII